MKAFILENIYMSYESAPAVISHSVFSTLDKAKEKVREKYEKSLKDYCGNCNIDAIFVEECYRDLYIKGPAFTDWWTIVEIEIPEDENQ
jgi:hypothetical protein